MARRRGRDVPTTRWPAPRCDAGLKIVDLLAASGLAASKSAARRLVAQGGVRVGERKVESVDDCLLRPDEVAAGGVLLHAGKKHLRRIVVRCARHRWPEADRVPGAACTRPQPRPRATAGIDRDKRARPAPRRRG